MIQRVAARTVVWPISGFALSMTPLIVVAMMGWQPGTGSPGFMAPTLGGAAAADVLIDSGGVFGLAKQASGA